MGRALALIGVALACAAPARAADSSPLIQAIRAGDRAAIQRELAKAGAVAAVEADGTTPLHAAALADDVETVRLLVRKGAQVNAITRYGVTPLALAALNGSAPITSVLLEAGADPNLELSEKQTILMAAARTGNPDVVRLLVAAGADVNARESIAGETALMWAAFENHGPIVRLLAAHGADVDARSTRNSFPRFKFGDGIVARPTVLPKGGWTALMYAARQNAMEAAAALLESGADPNLTDPDGTSALVFAIINAHYDLAAMLVEKGADPDVADVSGMTAIYAAVDMHTLDVTVGRPQPKAHSRIDLVGLVRLMLTHGADANARLKAPVLERLHNDGDPTLGNGATAFMRAAKDADVAMMRVLLDHGADPRLVTRSGRTALMYAAGRQNGFRGTPNRGSEPQALEAIALCLEAGIDVNAVDENGQTALHLAVAQAEDSVITLLSRRGANLFAQDARGRTPLALVTSGGGRGGRTAARPARAALLEQLMAQSNRAGQLQ
jgi:ankyrin repeat protein